MSAYFADGLKAAAVDVGDSPRIRTLRILNLDATVAYLQLFAKPASAIIPGTTVPDWQIPVGKSEGLTLDFDSDPVALAGGKPGFSMLASTAAGGAVAPATGLSVALVAD